MDLKVIRLTFLPGIHNANGYSKSIILLSEMEPYFINSLFNQWASFKTLYVTFFMFITGNGHQCLAILKAQFYITYIVSPLQINEEALRMLLKLNIHSNSPLSTRLMQENSYCTNKYKILAYTLGYT